MNNIIAGTILIVLSLVGMVFWWWDVLMLLKGLVPIALLALGIVAVAAGVSTLNEKPKTTNGKVKVL